VVTRSATPQLSKKVSICGGLSGKNACDNKDDRSINSRDVKGRELCSATIVKPFVDNNGKHCSKCFVLTQVIADDLAFFEHYLENCLVMSRNFGQMQL